MYSVCVFSVFQKNSAFSLCPPYLISKWQSLEVYMCNYLWVWCSNWLDSGSQTDGWAIAYSVLSIYAMCCRTLKNSINCHNPGSTVWVEKIPPPCGLLTFFPNGWEFLISFFTRLLCITIYARWQKIYLIISNFDKVLCHTKRDHPSNFLHFTRT